MPVTIVHTYLKKQIHLAVVPANGICFCESTPLSSPIAALGGHFLVGSRAAGHRDSYNGSEG